MPDFDAVPVLDFSLRTADRSAFLTQLRHALLNVGFLYLTNHPVDTDLIDTLVNTHVPALFALPQGEKDRIRMANSPHFLGYSRLGAEITKGAVDYREQFDIATDHVCRWTGPTDPDYYRLWGPSQVGYAPSKYADTHRQRSGQTKRLSLALKLFSGVTSTRLHNSAMTLALSSLRHSACRQADSPSFTINHR